MNEISASILTCNTAFLGNAVLAAREAGAGSLHVDITDGRYCGNFSFGPKTIADLGEVVDIPIEAHLELYDPQYHIDAFAKAGADWITIQSDSCPAPLRALQAIRALGKQAGIGFSPACGLEPLEYFAPHVDYVVLLSVEPGFGGQKPHTAIYQKIRDARRILGKTNPGAAIAVDGGVCADNAKELLECGAQRLIIGSALFPRNSVTDREIRECVLYYKNI